MRKNICVLSAAAAFLMLLSSAYAIHGQENARVTGTYTNMSFIPEAGDVVGEELRIVVTFNGYQAPFKTRKAYRGRS